MAPTSRAEEGVHRGGAYDQQPHRPRGKVLNTLKEEEEGSEYCVNTIIRAS